MSRATSFLMFVSFSDRLCIAGHELFDIGNLVIGVAGYVVVDGRPATDEESALAIAEAYARHGPVVSQFLLGQYSAVIADLEKKLVVLVQDSLGLRTVYRQNLSEGRLVAASDLRAMQAAAPTRVLDEDYFHYFLAFGTRITGRTPYARVSRLSMGETLVLTAGSEHRYYPWRPSKEAQSNIESDPEEALCALVNRAVVAALPREGNVLSELSGGLDSSTVTCVAHRVRDDIEALTFVSGTNRSGDDPFYSEIVVRSLGNIKWRKFDQDPYPPFCMKPPIAEVEPGGEIRMSLRIAYYDLLRAADIGVVLTGAGGDQVFGSVDMAPTYIADGVRELNLARSWRDSALWRHNARTMRSETFWLWHYGVRGAWRHWRGRSLVYTLSGGKPPWLSDRVLKAIRDVSPRQIAHRLRLPSHQHYWEMLLRLAEHESLVPNQRTPSEFRHPLLYRPLAEYMITLGAKHRRGELGDRALQRKALRGLLPEPVRTRVDKGTNQQLREQSFLVNHAWMEPLVQEPKLLRFGWIKSEQWAETINRARFGVVSHPMALDAAMCVEHWLRLNDIGALS